MNRSVEYWLTAQWKATGLANDALPASVLAAELRRLTSQWEKTFDGLGSWLGKQLVQRVQKHADTQLENSLRGKGFKVKFVQTREMQEAFAGTVQEQVGLIKSIPQQYMSEVQGLVMRSVSRGRDLAYLTKELTERFHITYRRAKFIARDQNNKATSVMQAARQMQLGITEGIWNHSHAGKHPRPSHVAANGKRFNLATGLEVEGEKIMPGEKPNCRCTWQPIIPGFED
jgi:SPP1 gp7 family putative phage head morphogenesis protein